MAGKSSHQDSEIPSLEQFDAIEHLIWLVAPTGKITWLNRFGCWFFGVENSKIHSLNWQAVIHPEDWEENFSKWEQSFTTGESLFKDRLRFKKASDQQYYWHRSQAFPFSQKNEKGGWIGFSINVQEEVSISENSFKKKNLFDAIIEETNELISIHRQDGSFAYLSPSIEKILGYSVDEYLQFKEDEKVHPDDNHAVEKYLEKAIVKEPHENKLRVKHRNGSYKWLESSVTFPTLEGEPVSLMISRDITEKKAYEDRLNALFTSTQQSMVLVDRHEKLCFFNAQASANGFQVFGRFMKEGDSIFDYVLPQDKDDVQRTMEVCWGGKAVNYERVFDTGHTSKKIWHRFQFEPVYLEREQTASLVFISIIDISSRKQAEIAKQQQAQQLKNANREMDLIIQGLSHDLKAPINRAVGLLGLIKKDVGLSEEVTMFCEHLHDNLEQLNQITSDLLGFSVNARTGLSSTFIDWEEVVKMVIAEHRFSEGFTALEWKIAVNQKVPFRSDMSRLKMIFRNLLSNALKYRNEYAEQSQVSVSVNSYKSVAVIRITDNGIGISKDQKEKIFDIFYRANNSFNQKGTGLGLYIVKTAIEKLNGKIWVGSEIERGTCFVIRLPFLK